jgi:hypothetical protein
MHQFTKSVRSVKSVVCFSRLNNYSDVGLSEPAKALRFSRGRRRRTAASLTKSIQILPSPLLLSLSIAAKGRRNDNIRRFLVTWAIGGRRAR